MALLIFVAVPLRGRRALAAAMPVMLMAMTLMLGGCGGDDNNWVPATPTVEDAGPGTYTVTVTAVSSGIAHTLVLKVVVR